MHKDSTKHIPSYLLSTYKMLECAFSNGIPEEEYLSLLVILYNRLSHRNIVEVVAEFKKEDNATILNDVYRALSTDTPNLESIAKTKQRLLHCGYQGWLAED